MQKQLVVVGNKAINSGQKMSRRFLKSTIFLLIFIFSARAFANDDLFFENLISNNVKETEYSALIKTLSFEPVNKIISGSGSIGYITYKFIAEVEKVFKGLLNKQIEYYVTYEAGIKPALSKHSQIISLCLSQDKKLYVPDNGYRIDATDKLITIAKEAASKSTKNKNTCR
ncbi:MAG: hypothetical protein OQK98_08310 [Gammaproteobacteria bacterium]|nr:hypothetical protein [Gammaproteobacteria bacterium]